MIVEKVVNAYVLIQIRILVRIPMGLPYICLSKPIIVPASIAHRISGHENGVISNMFLKIFMLNKLPFIKK